MENNYRAVCDSILKQLPSRSREILERRFGLGSRPEMTLESIGRGYGICRERVRQIEENAIRQVKDSSRAYRQKPIQHIEQYIRQRGGLKKEESLIAELSSGREKNSLLFLLKLGDQFKRLGESGELYPFWVVDSDSMETARRTIADFIKTLGREQKPLTLDQYLKDKSSTWSFGVGRKVPVRALFSYLEISKLILRTPEGRYGLTDWPEINPRGVKDKAYIALKKVQKPVHFFEVAKIMQEPVHVQTIHNELIKDPRFVLVGRGVYALREWGYRPGVVREVISDVLKKAKKPLSKPEILGEVQKQRLVKENTILLNLNNREYFLRDPQGKYHIREA